MTPQLPQTTARQRVVSAVQARARALLRPDDTPDGAAGGMRLAARVAALEEAVAENRRLNQRLADVLDVVTEVLVPTVDRDDERLRTALSRLNTTLGEKP